jgi:nitrite reductase/ring-hydroxylating ferredoxin subunit
MADQRSAQGTTDHPGVIRVAVGPDLYEVPERCPHAGAPLAEAEISGPFIRCIWHGATFDVRDGRWLRGPLCPDLRTHLIGPTDEVPTAEGGEPCHS